MKIVRFPDAVEVRETQLHIIVYSVLSILGGLVALTMGLLFIHELAVIIVGILFVAIGLFMLWTAETIITELNSNGGVVIKYVQIIGYKKWVRKLDRSNIQKIDYVKSFDENSPIIGKWHYISTIYLDVNFNEQIKIGSRLGATWVVGPQIIKTSVPLDTEANEIAMLLNVRLNTIDAMGLKKGVKNFYDPIDKMRPILQRPTQQQLDRERDVISAESTSIIPHN